MKVLVVEDNEVNRRVAIKATESLGHSVKTAENGLEALHATASERFDVILMDVQMPVMDGLEATRRILAESLESPPKIVGLTANAVIGDREACLSAGMDDYLTKPLRINALREALEGVPEGAIATNDRRLIDEDQLGSIVDVGDTESMEIFTEFEALASEQVSKLQESIAESQWMAVQRIAHQLKGSSGTFGFVEFAHQIGEIEVAAKKSEPPAQGLAEALTELLACSFEASRRVISRSR